MGVNKRTTKKKKNSNEIFLAILDDDGYVATVHMGVDLGDDEELDVQVEYKLEMQQEMPPAVSRPSQLRDFEIDLDSTNRAMDAIEKQSPIIERELLTTEQQLENFRSRLAMSDAVSAVTASVLDSIRREYNLPESRDDDEDEPQNKRQQHEEDEDEEEEGEKLVNSSSNDESFRDHQAEKEVLQNNDESSLLESSSGAEEAERRQHQEVKEEAVEVLSVANEAMRERIEELEKRVVHDVIERFARESQSQIEKIMMVQNLDEPDEILVAADDAAELLVAHSSDDASSSKQQQASESEREEFERRESGGESRLLGVVERKKSLSQTQLIESLDEQSAESGEELFRAETRNEGLIEPHERKMSLSQTKLIESHEEEVSESGEEFKHDERAPSEDSDLIG